MIQYGGASSAPWIASPAGAGMAKRSFQCGRLAFRLDSKSLASTQYRNSIWADSIYVLNTTASYVGSPDGTLSPRGGVEGDTREIAEKIGSNFLSVPLSASSDVSQWSAAGLLGAPRASSTVSTHALVRRRHGAERYAVCWQSLIRTLVWTHPV